MFFSFFYARAACIRVLVPGSALQRIGKRRIHLRARRLYSFQGFMIILLVLVRHRRRFCFASNCFRCFRRRRRKQPCRGYGRDASCQSVQNHETAFCHLQQKQNHGKQCKKRQNLRHFPVCAALPRCFAAFRKAALAFSPKECYRMCSF